MSTWIVRANPSQFRIHDFIRDYGFVEYRQTIKKMKEGDIVYLYITGDDKRVEYKMVVERANIPLSEAFDDSSYSLENPPSGNDLDYCIRYKKIARVETDELCYKKLVEHGFTYTMQSDRPVNEETKAYIESIFKKKTMSKNREWAMKAIPVLVRWAQATWDQPHYYSQLKIAIGHNTNRLGGVMGRVHDIIKELGERTGEKIPTLNGLVQDKSTGLPNDGFVIVIDDYKKEMPNDLKRSIVRVCNEKAHQYDWSWVLKELGLEPAKVISEDKLSKLKVSAYGSGGEGKEHKALKEYIHNHPESIGIKGINFSETEHDLLSGDSLDVFFDCKSIHYAIEVKPKTSPVGDVIRGVFQCVKYKAVMDAMRVADNGNYENETLLVLGGEMPDSARQIANDLNIQYIECFPLK